MESKISLLPKPQINLSSIPYINQKKKIIVNLYEVNFQKPLIICQYPYYVTPEIDPGNFSIRDKLFRICIKELKEAYGECFISGDSFYCMKKIDYSKIFKIKIFYPKFTQYKIEIQKCKRKKIIRQEDISKSQLTKQFINLIIRDIFLSNQKLCYYKGLLVIKKEIKWIFINEEIVKIYPGFKIKFMETEGGSYLNVSYKTKIAQEINILQFLKHHGYKNKNNQEKIKKFLIGKSFNVYYTKKNYIIDDILFESNPQTQKIFHYGKWKNLIEYYQLAHNIKINDEKQPLILVKKQLSKNKIINLYFIPEICSLVGLDDKIIKNHKFMTELTKYTKIKSQFYIQKLNEFICLLNDNIKDPYHPENLTSKEKAELYGIEIKTVNSIFDSYYIKETKFYGKRYENVKYDDRTFPVLEKVN